MPDPGDDEQASHHDVHVAPLPLVEAEQGPIGHARDAALGHDEEHDARHDQREE